MGRMNNIDSEIVLARLRLITKYYNTLEEFCSISIDEFLDNFVNNLL
jgi:hypothetical protein